MEKSAGTLKLKENITFVLRHRITREVIDKWEICNDIVTVGKEYVARILSGDSADLFRYIAIGTGTTAVTATDTSLETEVERALATNSYEATAKHKLVKEFTFTSAENHAITEVGVFDAAFTGHMLNRSVFTARNVDIDTSLEVTVRITIA